MPGQEIKQPGQRLLISCCKSCYGVIIELLQSCYKEIGEPVMRTGKERQTGWIRTGLLGVAALCIVIGAVRGEAQEVLVKAVNICLECIGIG